MMSRTGRRSGFTLVELIVAAVVLTIGLVGTLVALGRIVEGALLVVTSAQATVVVQHVLDELELQALARGPALPETGAVGRFQWRRQIVPDQGEPPRPLETWTATVTWPVRRQSRQLQLSRVWASES